MNIGGRGIAALESFQRLADLWDVLVMRPSLWRESIDFLRGEDVAPIPPCPP